MGAPFSWWWFLTVAALVGKSVLVLYDMYGAHSDLVVATTWAVSIVAALAAAALLLKGRAGQVYLLGVNTVISLLFLVDVLYARAFGHLISLHMLFATANVDGLGPSVLALARWSDLLFLADLPLFAAAVWLRPSRGAGRRLGAFAVVAVLSVGSLVWQGSRVQSAEQLSDRRVHGLALSPLGAHAYEVYQARFGGARALTQAERERIDAWFEDNQRFLTPSAEHAGLGGLLRGKNLVAVQFESLESIVLEERYHGQEVTPRLNALLPESLVFSDVVEQVQDGNSADADLLYTTSLYPLSAGSAWLRAPENQYVSLPKLLDPLGYSSVAVHGDAKGFWNRDIAFSSLGYDRYVTEEQFADQRAHGMGILDESLFRESLRVIDGLEAPFNLTVLTITSHTPFAMPEELEELKLPVDGMASDYLQSIRYVDTAFGAFYDDLAAADMLDDTAFVIFGDHEGIHKYSDGGWLPENGDRVPFIVHVPGLDGQRVDIPGGQVDMLPTLAFLLGIDVEDYGRAVLGRNLLGDHTGSAIRPNGQVAPGTDAPEHLRQARQISDLIIRSDYFGLPEPSAG